MINSNEDVSFWVKASAQLLKYYLKNNSKIENIIESYILCGDQNKALELSIKYNRVDILS